MIAVNKDLPVKNYAEFADWVNKQPEKVRFACSGIGNQPHLWGELFKTRNKLNMEVVGYKGSADAIRDVMGGHVPMIIDVVLPTGKHVAGGPPDRHRRGLGRALADLPRRADGGRARHEGPGERGVLRPRRPGRHAAAVVERLNALCLEIVKDPAVKAKFAELGFVTTGSTPEAYLDKLKFETARWTKVVKDNDIKVEG